MGELVTYTKEIESLINIIMYYPPPPPPPQLSSHLSPDDGGHVDGWSRLQVEEEDGGDEDVAGVTQLF